MPEILRLIQERQSARVPFDPKQPVSKRDLELILEAGRWAPTAHNMQNFEIIVVDDQQLLEAIGNIDHPISETFIRENYQQLSFSEEELLKKKVGLLATMFPAAWRNSELKMTEVPSVPRSIPICPVMLVVLYDPSKRAPASEGDFLGIISLGCATENMWLMANSLKIGFHVVSSLAGDPVEKEVKSILHIPDSLKIVYAIRLGYPITSQHQYVRVRREIGNFTYHNRFGNKRL